MEAGIAEHYIVVIEMIEDNNPLTIMPCFLKSNTEPTRHLTLITSGLESSHLGGLGSIILMVMTTRLMSIVSEGCDAGETYLCASTFLILTIYLH